jgi:hypothetical protein
MSSMLVLQTSLSKISSFIPISTKVVLHDEDIGGHVIA